MLTSTRRRIASVAMVLLVPTLGACGFGYQTDQVYQPGVGVNNRDSTVDVLGAVVVSTSDGRGTLVASLVNKDLETDDELVSVTGDDLEIQLVKPVEVPADTLVNLAETGAILVEGDSIKTGGFARITLKFESGQETEINAPIVPFEEEYAGISPAIPPPTDAPSTAP